MEKRSFSCPTRTINTTYSFREFLSNLQAGDHNGGQPELRIISLIACQIRGHDAAFFELVHDVLLRARREQADGKQQRYAFPHDQLVAPFNDGELPSAECFQTVRFRDVSSLGFSFYASQPPESPSLAVIFGLVPHTALITAEVQSVRAIDDGPEQFLVECHFTSRLTP